MGIDNTAMESGMSTQDRMRQNEGQLKKLLSVTCRQLIKMAHLCLDSLGKEACLPRPECAAVEKIWQLLSPVAMESPPAHIFTQLFSLSK